MDAVAKIITNDGYGSVSMSQVAKLTGSSPVTTSISGMKENAAFAVDYLNHRVKPGHHVAVIGAGLTGTETACDLAEQGYQVDPIRAITKHPANANECLNNEQHLKAKVTVDNVTVHTSAIVKEVENGQTTYVDNQKQVQTLACDTVLNAIGFRSNDQLSNDLYALFDDHANVIGDALQPRKIMNAIHGGYHTIRTME